MSRASKPIIDKQRGASRARRNDLSTPAKRAPLRADAPRNGYWSPATDHGKSGLQIGWLPLVAGGAKWKAQLDVKGSKTATTLGWADDLGAPEGVVTMTHAEAVAAAIAWGLPLREAAKRDDNPYPAVSQCLDAYLAVRDARDAARGTHNARNARTRLTAALAGDMETRLHKLTESRIESIAQSLPGTTENAARTMRDLLAMLGHAREAHRSLLTLEWVAGLRQAAKRGLNKRQEPAKRRSSRGFLTATQVRSIIEAAEQIDPDVAALITVLSYGPRFSQVSRLTVGDLRLHPTPRLLVHPSYKGNQTRDKRASAQSIWLSAEDAAVLARAAGGRPEDEPLLLRNYKVGAGRGAVRVVSRGAWTDSNQMRDEWIAALRLAGVKAGVQPYRLRDFAIVALLRAGVGATQVGILLDTSTTQIERRYASEINDLASDVLRAALASRAATPQQDAPGLVAA